MISLPPVIEWLDPVVERVSLLTWAGTQRSMRISYDQETGDWRSKVYGEEFHVVAYTKAGAYRKLAKKQEGLEGPRVRRQVQKGGDGAVQVQVGGSFTDG